MPKVPQVFSSGESGGTPGGARLNPEGFAKLATSGIRTGASEINDAAKQYEHIYTTLRTEAEKLEAEKALGEAQRQFADADVALKTDPNITAEQYPQEVARQLKTIREGVGKSLQYPGARMMFERGAEHFTTQQTIKAKYEGVEMLNAQVRATTDLVIRDDVNQAVHGPTPEVQEAAVTRALSRIAGLTNQRIYSGAESAAKTAAVLAQVEEGRLRRDFKNPAMAPAIITGLTKGAYPNLGVEGQRQLAGDLVREQKAEDERFKKERHEAEKAVAEEGEKAIQDAVGAGQWATAREGLQSVRRFLPATRYEHWADTIANREGKGAPSNAEVKKALNLAVYSVQADPGEELRAAQSVHDRIERAYRDNQLDDKDYQNLIGHATTRMTKSQDAKLSAVGREHAQAEQLISEVVRVPAGEFSMFLSGQAQNLKTMALEDLTRNSVYLGQGNEPPLKWFARQKAFYAAQLDTVATQRLSDIDRQLRSVGARVGVPITDAATLTRSKASFRTEADYYDAVRLFREAQEIRTFQQSFKPAAPRTPTAGASPPPAATPASAPGANPLGRR